MTRYRTIVADPPWPYGEQSSMRDESKPFLPYGTMTLDEIKALPVKDLAEGDKWHVNGDRGGCNLFLWTPTRYLVAAHEVCEAWRFKPTSVLVWCKSHTVAVQAESEASPSPRNEGAS